LKADLLDEHRSILHAAFPRIAGVESTAVTISAIEGRRSSESPVEFLERQLDRRFPRTRPDRFFSKRAVILKFAKGA
jgi:hypothetical protein